MLAHINANVQVVKTAQGMDWTEIFYELSLFRNGGPFLWEIFVCAEAFRWTIVYKRYICISLYSRLFEPVVRNRKVKNVSWHFWRDTDDLLQFLLLTLNVKMWWKRSGRLRLVSFFLLICLFCFSVDALFGFGGSAKSPEKSRKSGCVSWRQTSKCDPDGPRNEAGGYFFLYILVSSVDATICVF